MAFEILARDCTHISFDQDKERTWKEPFYFIQGADCQFGLIGSFGSPVSAEEWPEEIELSEKAVKAINALSPPPRFFIICGDLCNAFPDQEPRIRARQEADFKRIYGKLNPNIPLVCVCGNHDVGDIPTPQTVKMYRSSFGDDYFSFWVGGLLCIVLNSQLYKNSCKTKDLKIAMDTWLDGLLACAKKENSRVIVFQHIPYFLERWDEPEDEYFNLSPEVRQCVMDRLLDAGVTHAFCGHYHQNAGGMYKNLEVVVTSAIGHQLGNDKSGMRIVKVNRDCIQHSYHSFENFPSTVKLC